MYVEEAFRRYTTIEDLPFEILNAIFDCCFENQLKEKDFLNIADPSWQLLSHGLTSDFKPTSHCDRFSYLRSQTLFPYSLANVSQLWKDVMSGTPAYWSRLIFHLDSDSDELQNFELFLQLSKGLPLDIVILGQVMRPSKSYGLSREFQELSTVMRLLRPELRRIRSILVDTRLSSSLFLVHDTILDAESDSPLESIFLISNFADAKPNSREIFPTPNMLPSLKHLVLNGRDFDILAHTWLPLQKNLQQLVLSDCYFPNMDFVEVLASIECLPNLKKLKLKNVFFRINHFATPASLELSLLNLHLEGLAPSLIQELFRLCDFDELETMHFTRCMVGQVPSCDTLIIEDVHSSPVLPLELLLGPWDGFTLWISNYNGFNDTFLDTLRRMDGYTGSFKAPWMDSLYLYDISTVSLKKLKKMIKKRNQSIDYTDPNWRTNRTFGPAISKLTIDQCTIAELTPDDIEWFQSRVASFSYTPSPSSDLE